MVHHNLDTRTCAGVNTAPAATGVEAQELAQVGILGVELVGFGDYAHIEEWVGGDIPVLVDEAERYEFYASLYVGPSVAVGQDAALVDTTQRVFATEALVLI